MIVRVPIGASLTDRTRFILIAEKKENQSVAEIEENSRLLAGFLVSHMGMKAYNAFVAEIGRLEHIRHTYGYAQFEREGEISRTTIKQKFEVKGEKSND